MVTGIPQQACTQKGVSSSGGLCVGAQRSLCGALSGPTLRVGAQRSGSGTQGPALSVYTALCRGLCRGLALGLRHSGPGALCVYGSLSRSVSGPGALCCVCQAPTLSVSGQGAFCVGAGRFLCRGPTVSVSAPALSVKVCPPAVCREAVPGARPALSVSGPGLFVSGPAAPALSVSGLCWGSVSARACHAVPGMPPATFCEPPSPIRMPPMGPPIRVPPDPQLRSACHLHAQPPIWRSGTHPPADPRATHPASQPHGHPAATPSSDPCATNPARRVPFCRREPQPLRFWGMKRQAVLIAHRHNGVLYSENMQATEKKSGSGPVPRQWFPFLRHAPLNSKAGRHSLAARERPLSRRVLCSTVARGLSNPPMA